MSSSMRARLPRPLLSRVWREVSRPFRRRQSPCFRVCRPAALGRIGFEIGGPSALFARRGLLPLYPLAARVDNCNFGTTTIWEGVITEGRTFRFDERREAGWQFVAEATDLSRIQTASYAFVLSSHTLEHSANPLGALAEWRRILNESGMLVLVLPHKDGTFDHRRPVTSLDHLVEDQDRGTREDDLTHLDEILALHDPARDPGGAADPGAFRTRSQQNAANRCLHHHVFDTRLVVDMLDYAGWQIRAIDTCRPFHIIALAEQPAAGQAPRNAAFLADHADYRRRSPFASDRSARSTFLRTSQR